MRFPRPIRARDPPPFDVGIPMHVIIKSDKFSRPLVIQFDDESKSFDNFLALVLPDAIDSIEIFDWLGSKMPKKISTLTSIKEVHFVRCHDLECVPGELGSLPNLEHVAFTDCADFMSFRGIEKCKNCRVFRACRCDNLDEIDVDLSKLDKLVALDLSRCTGLRYVDLSKLPKQLAILDLHGASGAYFDADRVAALGLRSTQIQDYSRLISGMTLERPDDMVAQLQNAIVARSTAGFDD